MKNANELKQQTTTYGIFDKATGRQHKPKRRGFSGYAYPNEYAAREAIAAMPAGMRGRYIAKPITA